MNIQIDINKNLEIYKDQIPRSILLKILVEKLKRLDAPISGGSGGNKVVVLMPVFTDTEKPIYDYCTEFEKELLREDAIEMFFD